MIVNVNKVRESNLNKVDFSDLGFCNYYTDHMFTADYEDGKWSNFSISPHKDLKLSPACTSLHYGQTIFEGLKAYKNKKGEVLIFRPNKMLKDLIKVQKECVCQIFLKNILFNLLLNY